VADAEAKAKKREDDARELHAQVLKREQELAAQKDEQRKTHRELDDLKTELDRREQKTVEDEGKIKEREVAAEAGFLQQHRQALSKLDEEAKALAQQICDHHQGYLARLTEYEEKIREIRDRELAGLEEKRQQLDTQNIEVAKLKRDAEWAKQDTEEIKANWVARIETKVQEAVTDREARLQSALATCKDLAERISRYEQTESLAAGKTREELLAELKATQERNAKLVSELARKPGEEQVAQLRILESERETLLSDMAALRQKNQALELQMGKLSIGVAEMQNLRDQKAAWESRESALRTCIEGLRSELGELVDKSKAQRVFPSLTAMDDNPELQTPPERGRERLLSLKAFGEEIRNRIGSEGLFYRPEDIRAFIAGLATSRLHLLQGISGTGKTSLPRAFARAIGATSSLVEVQSGWRDRNDLLGYYNAFEKRFYESEFLQALYRAQQPSHLSLPYLIVLDEMNLSHPEHYFADFLSALEQRPADQRISLLTAKVDGAPQLLEESRWLRIPENVWFIGTANHDETTKDFADKTYDRSHVMQFPRHPKAFKVDPQNTPVPVTVAALVNAFQKARESHQDACGRAKGFLEASLAEMLAKLGIGWGNRLERQMQCFIPVVISAGGSLGEAADHLLATKLLRKLQGRFDIGAGQLKDFREHVLKAWDALEKNHLPEKCSELLDREIKRLSGGTT
jgi:MoxR-like ATPase